MSRQRDALVVGGGLAGAAVAQRLAAAGRDVTLVERESGPHDKVCGEFLSHEAVFYLARLGVDLTALGAVPIEAVGIAARGAMTISALPFPAFSLSRRRLDEALLDRAARAGTEILRGSGVKDLQGEDGTWTARLGDGQVVRAREAFLATGKHDLRGWRRPPGRQNNLVGLKLHFHLERGQATALEGHVELVLFPGGYGGLEPIEAGHANLCLLVRKRRLAAAGGDWDRLLAEIRADCPHLSRRLHGARPVQDRPLAVASIPYGFVRRTTSGGWHLGDQAAVIPSFAGEGMSIALHGASLAADIYLSGGTAADFQARLASDVSAQIARATLLSRLLVQGWAQGLLAGGAALWPAALAAAASTTRIPEPALHRLA